MWKCVAPGGAAVFSSAAASCRVMHLQSRHNSHSHGAGWLSCRQSVLNNMPSCGGKNNARKRGHSGFIGRNIRVLAASYNGYGSTNAGAPSNSSPKICILGGGFGGLYTAVRLENLMWPQFTKPQITLIDKNDRFVFKPLLYELVNGAAAPEEVAPFFTDLVGPMRNTQFLKGAVQSVHTQSSAGTVSNGATGGTIELADGQQLQYDWLVLALGSSTSFFGIPGVKEFALPFNDFNDAMQVLHRVEELERGASQAEVMVVGAGYAGVELASTVAERLGFKGRVKLVSAGGDILQGMPPGQVKVARSMLQDLNVDIVTDAMVSSIRQGQLPSSASASTSASVASSSQQYQVELKLPHKATNTVTSDLVLWTAGSAPASHAARKLKLPFESNSKGALLTDGNLQVLRQPRVFALGDVAGSEIEAETANLPPTAQVAFQQADYVAWNLWSSINRRPLLPFKYQHLGDMMSLGRVNGAVTFPVPVPEQVATGLQTGPLASLLGAAGIRFNSDDTQKGVTLQGPLAGFVRRAAYLYRQPTDQHRLRVGRDWVQSAISSAQSTMSRSRQA